MRENLTERTHEIEFAGKFLWENANLETTKGMARKRTL